IELLHCAGSCSTPFGASLLSVRSGHAAGHPQEEAWAGVVSLFWAGGLAVHEFSFWLVGHDSSRALPMDRRCRVRATKCRFLVAELLGMTSFRLDQAKAIRCNAGLLQQWEPEEARVQPLA